MIRKVIYEGLSKPQAYFIVGMPGSGKSTYAKTLIRNLNLKESDVYIQDDDVEIEKYCGMNNDPTVEMLKKAERDIEQSFNKYIDNGGSVYINVNVANVTPKYVYSIAEILCEYFNFDVNIIVIDCALDTAVYARSGQVEGQRYVEKVYIEETYDTIQEIIKDNGRKYCREIENNIDGDVTFRIYKR